MSGRSPDGSRKSVEHVAICAAGEAAANLEPSVCNLINLQGTHAYAVGQRLSDQEE